MPAPQVQPAVSAPLSQTHPSMSPADVSVGIDMPSAQVRVSAAIVVARWWCGEPDLDFLAFFGEDGDGDWLYLVIFGDDCAVPSEEDRYLAIFGDSCSSSEEDGCVLVLLRRSCGLFSMMCPIFLFTSPAASRCIVAAQRMMHPVVRAKGNMVRRCVFGNRRGGVDMVVVVVTGCGYGRRIGNVLLVFEFLPHQIFAVMDLH